MESNYRKTLAGSVGAGMSSIFNGNGRQYYILEHRTESELHHMGESQKIIIDQIELGCGPNCQVRFGEDCPTVSNAHAAIVKSGNGWKLIHLSHTNGTYVNGNKITGEWELNSGDEIRLSSNGPVIGFIVPQGAKSMVSSIGLTERMTLFRQQALKPYKKAIVALAAILIVAIGGLGFGLVKQSEKITESQGELALVRSDLNKANDTNNNLTEEIDRLQTNIKDIRDQKSEEYISAQNALAAAQSRQRELVEKINNLEEQQEDLVSKLGDKAENTNTTQATQQVATTVSVGKTSDMQEVTKYVYYVRMDDIEVFTPQNASLVKFNTGDMVGGTGFLLNNGIFVTADRVLEPWFYYRGTLGIDTYGKAWSFEDIQVLANNGYKIVANFSAYSSNGNFKFDNSAISNRSRLAYNDSHYGFETFSITNNVIRKQLRIRNAVLYWHSKYAASDWASIRYPSASSIGGLPFDNTRSVNPRVEDVSLIGFPHKIGYSNSQSVKPITKLNRINIATLNLDGIIELAGNFYETGYDGAPVLVQIDDVWTVIGILSHVSENGRDYVVPIQYISK